MHDQRQPRPCQPADGARSRGPRTVAGKARSARNALKHGLRARRVLLLDREDSAEFRAFATRLQAALMPEGALQESLVSRIVIAAWRSRRAARRSAPTSVVGAGSQARLEQALLGRYVALANDADPDPQAALGAGLIQDGHGARALETLLRDRGSALADGSARSPPSRGSRPTPARSTGRCCRHCRRRNACDRLPSANQTNPRKAVRSKRWFAAARSARSASALMGQVARAGTAGPGAASGGPITTRWTTIGRRA